MKNKNAIVLEVKGNSVPNWIQKELNEDLFPIIEKRNEYSNERINSNDEMPNLRYIPSKSRNKRKLFNKMNTWDFDEN